LVEGVDVGLTVTDGEWGDGADEDRGLGGGGLDLGHKVKEAEGCALKIEALSDIVRACDESDDLFTRIT
jgi:hypothetical protein